MVRHNIKISSSDQGFLYKGLYGLDSALCISHTLAIILVLGEELEGFIWRSMNTSSSSFPVFLTDFRSYELLVVSVIYRFHFKTLILLGGL
jgi:hypothetical protein